MDKVEEKIFVTKPSVTSNYDYSIYYKTWHDGSDENNRDSSKYIWNQIKKFLPPASPIPILDIGCGMGFALTALSEHGFSNLQGIDTDKTQVMSSQSKGLDVKLVDDSFDFLTEHPEKYEVVLMLDVLEHVPVEQQIALMGAVYHSLKPGGRVILQVPNASSILASRWLCNDFTHYASFTEHSIKFVLKNAGFVDLNIPVEKLPKRPSLRLWKRSARINFRRWLIRYLWRQILIAEYFGSSERIDEIPLSLNLMALAFKPSF